MYKHKKLDILQLPVKSSLEHIQISSELAARLVPQEVSIVNKLPPYHSEGFSCMRNQLDFLLALAILR